MRSTDSTSDWLNLREAAGYLGIHPNTLAKHALDWEVPHYRIGGRQGVGDHRFRRAELEVWLESRRVR